MHRVRDIKSRVELGPVRGSEDGSGYVYDLEALKEHAERDAVPRRDGEEVHLHGKAHVVDGGLGGFVADKRLLTARVVREL